MLGGAVGVVKIKSLLSKGKILFIAHSSTLKAFLNNLTNKNGSPYPNKHSL